MNVRLLFYQVLYALNLIRLSLKINLDCLDKVVHFDCPRLICSRSIVYLKLGFLLYVFLQQVIQDNIPPGFDLVD